MDRLVIYRQVADRQDGLTNSGQEFGGWHRLVVGRCGWHTDWLAAGRQMLLPGHRRQADGWQTDRRLADRQTAGIQTGGK